MADGDSDDGENVFVSKVRLVSRQAARDARVCVKPQPESPFLYLIRVAVVAVTR